MKNSATTRLNAGSNKVIDEGDLKDKLASQGIIPDGSTPREFAARVRGELARYRNTVIWPCRAR